MEREMHVINHQSHLHALRLTRLNKEGEKCKICQKELLSPLLYCCEKCNFSICRSCAKLPQQIKHPFHPQHNLTFCEKIPLVCSVCARLDSGYAYDCTRCKFTLHLKCAALKPIEKPENLSLEINHKHPLILCQKPSDSTFECFRCFVNIQDDRLFVCLACHYMLDEYCAAQPNEITHPFHLEHPLILRPRSPACPSDCNLCAMGLDSYTSVYNCFTCNFNLDAHCATLMPATNSSDPDQGRLQIQPATHPHPLIQCHTSRKNFARKCYACGLPFENSIYACLQCGILLHKSCADLPRGILHPFHPQHSLTLFENSRHMTLYYSSHCQACSNGTGKFVYICKDCNFLLDLRCATAKLPIITSELHEHALVFFDIETKEFTCNICKSSCSKFFFRCVKCNFNIHDHCYPLLPQTINHDCHSDPLTFTTSQIKDLPDEDEEEAELYCNACEERRKLVDPTYYCADCHFVAHVHCVITKILLHLQRVSEPLDSKIDNIMLGTHLEGDDAIVKCGFVAVAIEKTGDSNVDPVQQLDDEIAALEKEIDEITRELQELNRIRSQQIATLEFKHKKKVLHMRNTGQESEIELDISFPIIHINTYW